MAPWSGPDLPGSVASTLKYRLIVAAAGDATVSLHAAGLAHDWVASFCADGLCSPQQVSFKSAGQRRENVRVPTRAARARRSARYDHDQRCGRQYRYRSDRALILAAVAAAAALLLAPSVTHHTVRVASGDVLTYTATAGMLTLRDEHNDPAANVFYVAYTTGDKRRPVTFSL